jgi:hypothetical protein
MRTPSFIWLHPPLHEGKDKRGVCADEEHNRGGAVRLSPTERNEAR